MIAQITIDTLLSGAPTVLAIIGAAGWLDRRLTRLETKFDVWEKARRPVRMPASELADE